jgi:membrane-bound ClpP family serine protease
MNMGILVIILGIIFLLKDLGVWNFWGITIGTVALVLVGIAMMEHSKYEHKCVEVKVTKTKKKAKKK